MSISRHDIMTASAAAIITDRAHEQLFMQACEDLGGHWATAPRFWKPHLAYAMAIATDKRRLRKRAPYLLYAASLVELQAIMDFACSQLHDVKCAWFFLLDEGPANDLARSAALADSKIGGHA